MRRREMIKMAKTLRNEMAWLEKENAKRVTRESNGREEAYRDARERLDALIDCWRCL